MSIVSIPFLFLFFPLSLAVYYALPKKKTMLWSNLFLLLISLVFYAWGEPIRVLLLCALIVATWLLGRWVVGKKGTALGKWIVFFAVLLNAGTLFVYKYLDFTLENLGWIIGKEITPIGFALPLGLSFFCFQAISFVVDVYRGKIQTAPSLLNTALYLSVFFKITQGPITQYYLFEPQINERKTTWAGFTEGMWRFIKGFGKKVIIASNLSYMVTNIFVSDAQTLPVLSAWLGCGAYMIQIFFDFSGYSDMAIGLGKMFGFEIPENFDYPYIATSVTEYWQRWHISLGAWFRDYMFYPLTLGPAVRMRKRLAKRKANKNVAKFLQNLFVTGCIWFTTGLWHGATWNYVVWGLVNGAFVIWELYKKPLKHQKLDKGLGWLYTIAVAFFTKAFTCTKDIKTALLYFGSMLGLNGNAFVSDATLFYVKDAWVFLVVGILASFPIYSTLKEKCLANGESKWKSVISVVEIGLMTLVFVLSVAYLFKNGYTAFIYQKF